MISRSIPTFTISGRGRLPISAADIERLLRRSARRIRWPKDTAIEIAFVSDSESRKWNKTYRGKDRATNVLSFGDLRACPPLAEILIARGVLRREAAAGGWTLRAYALRLLVHGLLHIAGHDHEEERDAKIMERLERWMLQPYQSLLT